MRVLLADDHALFRAGMASLLRTWGMEIVGQAANGVEAVELAARVRPDLILMDIGMQPCNGLEATRRVKEQQPDVAVVIVTVSDDDDDLFEAIKCGAEGYLLKGMSEQDLNRILGSLAAGEPALSPGLAARILDEFARLGRQEQPQKGLAGDLTERELEVLRLLAEGTTNRDIASALFVTESTVNFHVKNILGKLHLKNRSQAAAFAVRSGLADPDSRLGAAERR